MTVSPKTVYPVQAREAKKKTHSLFSLCFLSSCKIAFLASQPGSLTLETFSRKQPTNPASCFD